MKRVNPKGEIAEGQVQRVHVNTSSTTGVNRGCRGHMIGKKRKDPYKTPVTPL